MSDIKTIKKSQIFNEFSETDQKKWFSLKQKKFISHIDTFYYTIYPDTSDWRDDKRKDCLINILSSAASLAASSDDLCVPVFTELYSGLVTCCNCCFNMYKYHFSLKDAFDVFIADFTPNKNTPPIIVQLRSNGLWLKGVKELFDESLDCISDVLSHFNISIKDVVENRVDYAIHTNYIQNPLTFFPESDLKDMQISQFHRWHKEGDFFSDIQRCDYFTLGRRKSNSVFFRIYDKTKEVIEQGYKQFFIPIWYDQGLISAFDRYVLENTFMSGSFNAKEKMRCMFYAHHGKDPVIRNKINKMISNPDTPFSEFKKVADGLVPDITVICNVEFQCKRKFFYNLHKSIPDLRCTDDYKDHIYSLLEQSRSIRSYLTFDIIRFVQYKNVDAVSRLDRPLSDWWMRLRSSKFFKLPNVQFAEYCFSYQSNLDLQRVRNNTIKALARTSSYYVLSEDNLNSLSYFEDVSDFVSSMNDNDIVCFYRSKSLSFKNIERKKMKLSKSFCDDFDFFINRKRSVFFYWFSQLYHRRAVESAFYTVVSDMIEENSGVLILIRYFIDKYADSEDEYDNFCYHLIKRCLSYLKIKPEDLVVDSVGEGEGVEIDV